MRVQGTLGKKEKKKMDNDKTIPFIFFLMALPATICFQQAELSIMEPVDHLFLSLSPSPTVESHN